MGKGIPGVGVNPNFPDFPPSTPDPVNPLLPKPPENNNSNYPAPEPQTETALKFTSGRIMLARPWHELGAHICNCELPSWELIARAITVLIKAIFCCQWHLYDHVILARPEGFYHSKNLVEPGTVGVAFVANRLDQNEMHAFDQRFPHLVMQALYLKPVSDQAFPYLYRPQGRSAVELPPIKNVKSDGGLVAIPDFSRYDALAPQNLVDYYRDFYGIRIADKDSDNTIYDLIHSPHLEQAADIGHGVYMPDEAR